MKYSNTDLVNSIFEPIFGFRPFDDNSSHQIVDDYSVNMPEVRQVIFNENATIVYFEDDTKVVVRKSAKDSYNKEHAIVYAIVKRAYGTVDPATGLVEGNGMGNMLGRLIENAIVQESKPRISKNSIHEDCSHCERAKCDNNDFVKPWKTTTTTLNRDSKGHFVKKSNY